MFACTGVCTCVTSIRTHCRQQHGSTEVAVAGGQVVCGAACVGLHGTPQCTARKHDGSARSAERTQPLPSEYAAHTLASQAGCTR